MSSRTSRPTQKVSKTKTGTKQNTHTHKSKQGLDSLAARLGWPEFYLQDIGIEPTPKLSSDFPTYYGMHTHKHTLTDNFLKDRNNGAEEMA